MINEYEIPIEQQFANVKKKLEQEKIQRYTKDVNERIERMEKIIHVLNNRISKLEKFVQDQTGD